MSRPEESPVETTRRAVFEEQVAGMFILSPNEEESEYMDFLSEAGIPFVLVNRLPEDKNVSCVTIDNADIAFQAIDYLCRKGHRRIGFINGPADRPSSRARLRGVRMALLERNLPEEPHLIVSGNFQTNGGYLGMKEILKGERPTAVFAGNDYQAFGAIQALGEYGLTVPTDVAIVGCDDLAMSSWIRPPLTTIRVPFYEMGSVAANLLCRLAKGETPPGKQIILPSHLIERQSV